jgi:hypothetical protein
MDHFRLYDMSEPHSDIGVSLWGPGQALCFKTNMTTSCNTPTTPSYSQSLELENRMLDGSTMVTIPTHVSPLQAAVISTGPTADCSRHVVCRRPELQLGPQTTIASMPMPMPGGATIKSGGISKMRGVTEDPCQLAPLKKRKIQVETLSPDQRDRVLQKREKNKVAAEKCRIKRREKNHEIRLEYEEHLVANEDLESQIRKLREEYRVLQELLDSHPCVLQTACSRT